MDYFYGFADGSNGHTLNLASTVWVFYSLDHDLVSSGGFFLGIATNNIVEYHVVIGFLSEYSSHGVNNMIVYLES